MTILVLSDSHGNVGNMIRAVEQVQPDRVLHLGDCQRDLTALEGEFPALPMEGVPGNCDWGSCDQPERLLEMGGVRIFMLDNDGTLLTLNPGAAGDRLHPTCGILTIDNGHADVRTLAL